MAEEPAELKREIEATRQHLDEVATALGERFEDAVQSTKRRLSPAHVVVDYPGMTLAAAFLGGYLAGTLLSRS